MIPGTPIIPHEQPQEIEEIVSPVKPLQHPAFGARNITAVLIAAVALGATGYIVYNEWSASGGVIKTVNAPEDKSSESVEPVAPPVEPAPTEPMPEPRTSSVATTDPSPAPSVVAQNLPAQPEAKVAGSAQNTYTSPQGYSLTMPQGSSVSADGAVVAVYSKSGALLGRVEVVEMWLDNPDKLAEQLALSPHISNIQSTHMSGYPAYTYTIDAVPAYAVIRANYVYYVTEYQNPGQIALVL